MGIKAILCTLRQPSKRYSFAMILFVGFVAGIIFWGGFNTAMEISNTEGFCISCHEMEENVYREYQSTIHYSNRTGVRATCPDCHVPKEWVHKVVRKIKASNELYHKVLGTIDTPEKFEDKRLELARNVWRAMKDTDSRECRNCHDFESMDYMKQGQRSVPQHIKAVDKGMTCIDCHKGIAHSLPAMYEVDPETVTEGL
ncbi:NapC/NirT family cytochrome c [Pseudomonadota bacterium]